MTKKNPLSLIKDVRNVRLPGPPEFMAQPPLVKVLHDLLNLLILGAHNPMPPAREARLLQQRGGPQTWSLQRELPLLGAPFSLSGESLVLGCAVWLRACLHGLLGLERGSGKKCPASARRRTPTSSEPTLSLDGSTQYRRVAQLGLM